MFAIDKEAVICDLAETYNIYNYKDMPPLMVAVFCKGLRENSRIKLKIAGQKVCIETMLLASIVDRLGILIWSKTKDGQKGRNQPKSILESLSKIAKEKETIVFNTSEEFEKVKRKILEKGGQNGD